MEGYTNFTKVFADEVKGTAIVGPLTGDVTGNVTGNTAGTHTGAVTGDVTGNVNGMATLTAETVAAAGTDHTDATAITKQIALVTAADGNNGVILLGNISPRIIKNTDGGANVLKVYPVLGEGMDGNVDTAVSVAAGATLIVAKVGTGWYTFINA